MITRLNKNQMISYVLNKENTTLLTILWVNNSQSMKPGTIKNWVNEIERSKAALQATLIVRHEENKKLYVNFNLEIIQLIQEAKCLDR